jgi:HEAT repeat protein
MELEQIRAYLDSPNAQERMKAIVELRNYNPGIVVPLLKQRMYDQELIIRSFVAIGLGKKRNQEGFDALLNLIQYDRDYNIIAEAANSLAKYGDRALPYLVNLFQYNSHWLIRQSILAAIADMNHPDKLLQLSIWGLQGNDLAVKLGSIANLAKLATSNQAGEAVAILVSLIEDSTVEIRIEVAKALHDFDFVEAKSALARLRQDSDYRVVGATLEGLL